MIDHYKQKIRNVFVLINAEQTYNRNHFLRVSKEEWRIMGSFDNGGIEVNLVGWAKNKDGWGDIQLWNNQNTDRKMVQLKEESNKNIEEFRQKMGEIEKTKYELPRHMEKYKDMRGSRRVLEKRKARHLRAAYAIFTKRKDRDQAYQSYARKQLALKLTRRG